MFFDIFLQKTRLKYFRSSHEERGDAESFQETVTPGNFKGDKIRCNLPQTAKTVEQNALHLKKTLARPLIYN